MRDDSKMAEGSTEKLFGDAEEQTAVTDSMPDRSQSQERKLSPVIITTSAIGIVLFVGISGIIILAMLGNVVGVSPISHFDEFLDEVSASISGMRESSSIDDDELRAITGIFEKERWYYASEDGFVDFSSLDTVGENLIYIFTLDMTFQIHFRSDQATLYLDEGNFDIERISFRDIPASDREYMKYVNERVDSKWYRISTYDVRSTFGGSSEFEMFMSYVSYDDVIIYTPTYGITIVARHVLPIVESDPGIVEAIAGTYSERETFDRDSNTFYSIDTDMRQVFVFNPDATFRIQHALNRGVVWDEGLFYADLIATDDMREDNKFLMSYFDDYTDVDIYRITLIDVRNQGFIGTFNMYMLRDGEKAAIYIPLYDELIIARQIQ